MPVYLGRVTIKRNGRYVPPGTPIELTEDEAKALGPARVVLAPDHVSAPVGATAPANALAGLECAGEVPGDAPSSVEAPPDSQQKDGASNRIADIASAIDLLDEKQDFVKTGRRAGKPKQKPIEDIVGFDVADADIDHALALRESGV